MAQYYLSFILHLNLNVNVLRYANDAILLEKNKDYNELFKESNKFLDLIKNLCSNNNLQLNLSKYLYVIFNISNCTSMSNSFNSNLCMHSYNCKYLNSLSNYVPLKRVYSIKYLGINFDHR